MAFSTNDLRNGMTLDLPDGLFTVVEFQHVKPGKGGAFVRTKLRNVRNKAVIERTFRAGEQVEQAMIDKREMQYLYRDGQDYVFMDNVSYDQMHVSEASLAEAAPYLKEGDSADRADVRQRDRRRRPARPRSSSPSPRPSPACRATASPVPASRRRSRPASWSRCRCSSTPASASRSTPGPVSTSPGPEPASRRRAPGARHLATRAGARASVRGRDEGPLASTELLAELPVAPDEYAARDRARRRAASRGGGPACSPAMPPVGRSSRMPAVDRCVLEMATFELLEEAERPRRRRLGRGGRARQDLLHRGLGPLRERRPVRRRERGRGRAVRGSPRALS